MNLVSSLAIVSAALAACGGTKAMPDGAVADSTIVDVPGGKPPPPVLGAQIDRSGRAGIGAMLIATFTAPADVQAQKDAYNQASDPAAWRTTMLRSNFTIEDELKANLAMFDAIDAPTGCGNALDYARPVNAVSYLGGADLLADDQLYIDTAMATCNVYLALEIEQGGMGRFSHTECGGRTLSHAAVDVTYSVLAAGVVDGLDQAAAFSPRIHGSLTAHGDLTTTFPFLGIPHP